MRAGDREGRWRWAPSLEPGPSLVGDRLAKSLAEISSSGFVWLPRCSKSLNENMFLKSELDVHISKGAFLD